MFKQAFNRLIICAVLVISAQQIMAQGFQRIYDSSSRDLFHNCSSSTADGGFYVVSQFSVRNLPPGEDSVGVHVTRCDMKGELMWGREYFLEDAQYELYQKGIECQVLAGDTLAIVATDIESSGTADSKLFFRIEPSAGLITFQTIFRDIDMNTEDITPGIQSEILVDHNQEVFYMGSHNSEETIGVHFEKFGPQNETEISRTYIGLDADTMPVSLSLLDAQTLRDTGFVYTARLGDEDEIRGAMVRIDSVGDQVFASSYGVDNGSQLDLIGVTGVDVDSSFMQLGILSNQAAGTETSVLIKTDSIGRVIWAQEFDFPNSRSQAQEISFTFNNEVLVTGKYGDFGFVEGDYTLFFDIDGNILRQSSYLDENSVWDDPDNAGFQFDAQDLTNTQDGMLLITAQAQLEGLNYAPTVIKADIEGLTLCEDSLDIAILTPLEVLRDTLMLTEGLFAQRDSLELTDTEFGAYDIPTGNLMDVIVCPNIPVDTIFDATLNGVDSMFVSYMWNTGDTTAIINVVRPEPIEDEMFTVIITVLDQVCFTVCDTANLTPLPMPEAVIQPQYLCDTREWLLTVENTMGEIVSNVWFNQVGDTISTELTIVVPDEPGVVWPVAIIDGCGIEAFTTFTVPQLASIGAIDSTNLCPVPGFLTVTANADELFFGPFEFSWTINGASFANTQSINVTEADLNGGPALLEVTVTDACENISMASVVVNPQLMPSIYFHKHL